MKLVPVTKIYKRNSATSKAFYDDDVLAKCDVIENFPIYGQFKAIQRPDSVSMVYITYSFINNYLLSYKN